MDFVKRCILSHNREKNRFKSMILVVIFLKYV